MKIALLISLLLLAFLVRAVVARRRAVEAEAVAAQARAKAARRAKVPTVSNNLKGVTATQTIQPYKPNTRNEDPDERAA